MENLPTDVICSLVLYQQGFRVNSEPFFEWKSEAQFPIGLQLQPRWKSGMCGQTWAPQRLLPFTNLMVCWIQSLWWWGEEALEKQHLDRKATTRGEWMISPTFIFGGTQQSPQRYACVRSHGNSRQKKERPWEAISSQFFRLQKNEAFKETPDETPVLFNNLIAREIAVVCVYLSFTKIAFQCFKSWRTRTLVRENNINSH